MQIGKRRAAGIARTLVGGLARSTLEAGWNVADFPPEVVAAVWALIERLEQTGEDIPDALMDVLANGKDG